MVRYQKNQLMVEQIQTEGYKKIVRNLNNIPVSIMDVDAAGEASLKASDKVVSVVEEKYMKSTLKDTIPFLGGSASTGFSDGFSSYTGNGQIVAVIDEGFNEPHPMLDGSFTNELCLSESYQEYLNAIVESACPGSATESEATGSTLPNTSSNNHGSSVSSAAVGRHVTAGPDHYSGVAKASDIYPVKIVMKVTEKSGYDLCDDSVPTLSVCYLLAMSVVLTALDKIIDLSNDGTLGKPIAAINASFGSEDFYSNESACDAANIGYAEAFASLKLANIAPIVAAGNSGDGVNQDKLGSPACVTNAIGVSSSTRSDTMAYYSNAGTLTDLVAPGGDMSGSGDGGIILAGDGSSMSAMQGTSFAAPIVAGAYAVMREQNPTISVDTVLRVFQETGANVVENRAGYTAITHKRLALASALAASTDLPSITSVTPQGSSFSDGDTVSLDIVAPNAVSCSQVGGAGTASISSGQGTMDITIGGGTQSYLIECIDSNNYAARFSITLAASGSSGIPGSENVGSNGQVLGSITPGTPNTGFQRLFRQNILLTLALTFASSGLIIYLAINRKKLTSNK